jgi:hypothetical protein
MAGITLQHGVISASADNQLGTGTAGIIFNNAVDAVAYGTGGVPVLRITSSFSTPRVLTATSAGAVDVASGATLTLTGAASGTINKIGAGTVDLAVTNGGAPVWNINAGVLQTSVPTAAPFGTNASPVLNGGTLRVFANGADNTPTLGTGTLTYGGGGRLALDVSGTFNSQLTIGNLARSGQGTMVISPAATLAASTGQRSRLIVSTNIFGASAANVNGILSPSIVTLAAGAANTNADFVTWTGATNGLGVGTSTAFTGGSNPAQVGNTTGNTLSGVNSVYALRTTGNISGGTLQVVSNNTTTQLGGILMNGAGATAPVISSNLFFGLVNNNVTQLNGVMFGEGLVYTADGFTSGTPTLSGSVVSNTFTKFGPGTLLVSGTNRI